MTLDILRKTGGWCVELQQPLKLRSGEVTAIEIRPPTADHVIRWGAYQISSTLALLGELCDLTERQLRQLPAQDFERVYFALRNVVPNNMRIEIEEGKRLLATPDEDLPAEVNVPSLDQLDPRFPATVGPVVRLTERKPPPPEEDQPMNLDPPAISEVIR
jgi:hypothetical protein